MPWKETTVMDQKKAFIQRFTQHTDTFTQLCADFSISTKTGYKYLKLYNKHGFAGLKEKSRQPKTSPNKTRPRIEKLIIDVRLTHPTWAGEKIARHLSNKGHINLPSVKTMNRILKRNGFITIEESEKHTPWKRFEHAHPNDLWQMDFKGHFEMSTGRCHPLTLLDDHSRYSLLIKACKYERENAVKEALIDTFIEYGLPLRMTMDNGPPWGNSRKTQHTKLTAWLIRLGIFITYSRPKHPQTQGKLERFHRTLKEDLLNRFYFSNLKEAQRGFDWWRKIYNEERPHGAIDLEVPLKRYKHSPRAYSNKLHPIEYENGMIIRTVQKDGEISYKGKKYRIGSAYHGDPVGLTETLDDGIFKVYYCKQCVGTLDIRYPI